MASELWQFFFNIALFAIVTGAGLLVWFFGLLWAAERLTVRRQMANSRRPKRTKRPRR